MKSRPDRREPRKNRPRIPLATIAAIVVTALIVAGGTYLWYRTRMRAEIDRIGPAPQQVHSFKIYGADSMADYLVIDSRVTIPEDGAIEHRLQLLADSLSQKKFGGLPIEILRAENRGGDRIAIIDLRETETNRRVFAVQESLWAQGKGGEIEARKIYSEGLSWRLGFFQGSTGGYFTTMKLILSLLQNDYEGEWIDGIEFYYEGKPVSDEWDHIDLDGTKYRRAWTGTAASIMHADSTSVAAKPDSARSGTPAPAMPLFNLTADSTRIAAPRWPEIDGTCYLYKHYVVIAWGSPDPRPVAIVRAREGGSGAQIPDCRPDSLPGDFVVRNEWAEYFCGMWRDLLFIDSGTGDIRSLIIYHVPTGRKVFELDGAGEMAGWIDDVTVRIWVLAAVDLPRSLCPDIPEMLGVGVDSLYAFNLKTFDLTPLGPWRCHALQ